MQSRVRLRVRWSAGFVLGLLPAAGICAGQVQTFAPFMMPSDGLGELASSRYEFTADTTSRLEVRYQAPSEHCASLRLHLFVDGHHVLDTPPIAPAEQTHFMDLGPVTAGSHQVSLRAEGIKGGCNTGRVTAWGGRVTVWTSATDGLPEIDSRYLGAVVFEVEYENFAWGYQHAGRYITAAGDIVGYSVPSELVDAVGDTPTDGLITVEALSTKFGNNRHSLGIAPPAALERAKQLARDLVNVPPGTQPRRPHANDAGAATWAVYVATAVSGQYRRIALSERGDFEWDHAAPQAAELTRWMDQSAPH